VASVIQVSSIRKTYPSTAAIDDVSFAVRQGEIFGLIGPNGRRQDHDVECVEGLRRPDRGRISPEAHHGIGSDRSVGVAVQGARRWHASARTARLASVVPTARFAQPIASLVFYPMMALALIPVQALPPALRLLARLTPLTDAVSLLRGIIGGDPWSAHLVDVLALAIIFAACTALSSRVFRWE
jgi:energy-coupling factor transporter ATP-binding protein EcfA2